MDNKTIVITIEMTAQEAELVVEDLQSNLRTHRGRKGSFNPDRAEEAIGWRFNYSRPSPELEAKKQELRDEYARKYAAALAGEKLTLRLLEKFGVDGTKKK